MQRITFQAALVCAAVMLAFVVSVAVAAEDKPAPTSKADDKKDAPEKKELIHAAGTAAPGAIVIRVNCGAKEDYTDLSGVIWSADQIYSKEKKWGVDADLRTLSSQRCDLPHHGRSGHLHLRARQHEELPVRRAQWQVHGAPPPLRDLGSASKPGQRHFGVKIQGNVVLKDIDFVRDVGFMKPFVKEVKDVEVTDGKLLVEFIHPPEHQHPQVNAIEVIGQQDAPEKTKPSDKPKGQATTPDKKDTPEKK